MRELGPVPTPAAPAGGERTVGTGGGRTEVLIIGAGPAGLFLAGLLAQRGVEVVVLERRHRPAEHSRAIGLHPPALHALDRLGLAGQAIERGVQVRRGFGYGDGPGTVAGPGRLLGELSLARADAIYPFVLTLPQVQTEALLAARLEQLVPGAVRRGVEVTGLRQDAGGATVLARAVPDASEYANAPENREDGKTREHGENWENWEARVVVGADGTRGEVAGLAGVGIGTRDWGDHYLMGDFDGCGAEPAAHLHLHRHGVVERFPLPGGRWRWVVHTGRERVAEQVDELTGRTWERLGIAPDPSTNTMLSAFSVRRRLAGRLVSGRTVLIGDAAHGISPIGGQGMTLGWLDALSLAPLLEDLDRGGSGGRDSSAAGARIAGRMDTGRFQEDPGFARFDAVRRRAARVAAHQAETNMLLGRPMSRATCLLRDAALRAALAAGGRGRLVRLYTMGWAR